MCIISINNIGTAPSSQSIAGTTCDWSLAYLIFPAQAAVIMCTSTFILRGLASAAARNLSANDIIYLNFLDLTVIQSIGYHLGLPFCASERARVVFMDSYSQSPSSGAPPRKKLKIGNGNACELCRSKKIKCDGTRPGMFSPSYSQRMSQVSTIV